MDNFLFNAMIYLAAAVVFVPLAKKAGMGSVLGYLLAGVIIGPFLLGFIGEEGKDIMHFAEFGVVIMLFLIGLELEPSKLWAMRKRITGLGASQLFGTAAIFFVITMLIGIPWQSALAISLSLSMSSTAIVMQSYKEKGQMGTHAGRNSFAVLLFQDIALIPMLALFPLLAFMPVTNDKINSSVISDLPAILQTLSFIGAISIIVLFGRYVLVPFLKVIARTRLRELFVASALLIIVSTAFLMELVGLSPALGTFLAGVILANSEFKHELESNLEPSKGLLLGLFFIAVGASINFNIIMENPSLVVFSTSGVIFIKIFVLFFVGKRFRMSTGQNISFAIGLSQVGEFAFVLVAFMTQIKIITVEYSGLLMVITALSMTITPLFILMNEKLILPKLLNVHNEEAETESIDEKNDVIIAGFSHFGNTTGRFLRANDINATYLDYDIDRVELLRKMGFKVYYGDATRLDLLDSAGAENAKILIVAIGEPETSLKLVKLVKKHFPHLQLMVRAQNRVDAYELLDMGIKHVYRENLDSSIRLGVDTLIKLGGRAYSATRSGQDFMRYDEQSMNYLAEHRHHLETYISKSVQQIEIQEELLRNDREHKPNANDHIWDSEYIREHQKQEKTTKPSSS